jgi:hypothetical protein
VEEHGSAAPSSVSDIVPTLLASARSLGPLWQEHLDFWSGEEPGAYNDMSVIARHAVQLIAEGGDDELREMFGVVESLFSDHPAGEGHSLLSAGLLEDIQNITSHPPIRVGSSQFLPYLGPLTTRVWNAIHEGWGSQDTNPDDDL